MYVYTSTSILRGEHYHSSGFQFKLRELKTAKLPVDLLSTSLINLSHLHLSIRLPLQVSDLTNGTLLQEGHDKRPDFTLEEQLPDRGDFGGGDFLEDGFGFGDGGMGEFGELPNVPDLTVDEAQKKQEGGNLNAFWKSN